MPVERHTTTPHEHHSKQLPPGQTAIDGFPIESIAGIPEIDMRQWRLRIFGLVERTVELTYDELQRLPRAIVLADFHCVDGWSRLGDHWEGVLVREVIALAQPRPEAKYAMVYCYDGYSTNLELDALTDEDVVLAWGMNGQLLTSEHGYPLRLIVPKRYAYKSAKWVSGIELMAENRPGYWESRGYHVHADVWREERRQQ
ncbi:MAG TPA: sulfite oxidase-like oxidoreductase [Armatimonadetes bacterium]|nr:sulfite oxidase-like oxidoreductase [Armatimonadota bacterium]